jgi:inorganic pyrophosphatase
MEKSVDVLVEIPKGSRSKYELDERTGRLRLDRVLHSSVHYPADYGFIVYTLARDGDHLDVIVVVEEPAVAGSSAPALAARDQRSSSIPIRRLRAAKRGRERLARARRRLADHR